MIKSKIKKFSPAIYPFSAWFFGGPLMNTRKEIEMKSYIHVRDLQSGPGSDGTGSRTGTNIFRLVPVFFFIIKN
jgi:hypothetical protein